MEKEGPLNENDQSDRADQQQDPHDGTAALKELQ
jgi:hypothetical protein